MLSPRTMTVLCFFTDSPSLISSALFNTKFMCGTSYPSRTPWYARPDLSSTMTRLFNDSCKIFNGLSITRTLRPPNKYSVYKSLGNFYMRKNVCDYLITVKVKNKHQLKQKKAKDLIKRLERQFDESLEISTDEIFTGVIDDYVFYFVDQVPIAMDINDHVMMTLRGLLKFHPSNRFVTVDMGAVRFVTNGADIMAPGIVDADIQIEKDMPVWIRDEQHHKPIAIGVALMNGEEMIDAVSGKAVKMIHYIGDPIWKMSDVE